MKKIFLFILISLLFGSLALAQPQNQEKGRPVPEEAVSEVAPEFEFIRPKPGEKIQDKVEIEGKVKGVQSVEFYYQPENAPMPFYLGSAQPVEENTWRYSWNTKFTPNGKYQFFAKITNKFGEYQSPKIEIEIENEIKREIDREKELTEKIEKIKTEIKEGEKEIIQKKEKTKLKVLEEVKRVVDETKKLLKEEEKKTVEPRIEKKMKETKREVEKVEKMIENLQKAEEIEEKIEKKKKEKEEKETKIQFIQQELREIQKAKEKLLEAEKKKIKAIEEAKKRRLEVQQKEKEKIEKELTLEKEKLKKIKEEKEKIKREIIKEVVEPVELIEEKVPQPEKTKISEIKKSAEKKISDLLEDLERTVKEKEEIKIERKEILVKDSDGDGLSDEFEVLIGTDLSNPDSDGDGFLDGAEYQLGYDPLNPGAADKIVYSDARKAKPKKTEIYYVERVTTVTLPTGQLGIKIEGKGLPNSFVTIYIYSPIIMVTKTDSNGNWSIVLDKPLADGTHEVYTTVTNNHGEIINSSEPFVFEKSGERIVAITVSGFLSPKVISPIESYKINFIILTLALIILAIGIALIIIGISIQRKQRREKQNN